MTSPPKTIEIIGVPTDLGANRRGVDMGPSGMRVAGLGERIKALGYPVHDAGNLDGPTFEAEQPGDPHVKFLDHVIELCARVQRATEAALSRGHLPVVLGGDHSIALGTITGLSQHYKKLDQKIGLIWFDAHADMNTHETTLSGNIHGMPLSAILGYGHPGLTNFSTPGAKVSVENAVLIGIRDLDLKEKVTVKRSGITCYSMREIDLKGMGAVIAEAIAIAGKGTAGIHVSFDIDAIDPYYAPGVGTSAPGGLTFREAHLALEEVAISGKLIGLEMVEVNPILDNRNSTAELGAGLICSALGQRIL
jgi:arginase